MCCGLKVLVKKVLVSEFDPIGKLLTNIQDSSHDWASLSESLRLEVTASCQSYHETQVISGIYIPKGVFGGRKIYEKTVADYGGSWWSLRYDKPSEDPISTNRWIFSYNSQQVTVGKSIFGSVVENFSNKPGEVR